MWGKRPCCFPAPSAQNLYSQPEAAGQIRRFVSDQDKFCRRAVARQENLTPNGGKRPAWTALDGCEHRFSGLPVPIKIAQQSCDMGKFVAGKFSQLGDGLAQEDRRVERVVKKFGGCNAQKLTDSKKAGHCRQGLSVFDAVDIAGALAQRKAHVARGHFFLCAQLTKPIRKFSFPHKKTSHD